MRGTVASMALVIAAGAALRLLVGGEAARAMRAALARSVYLLFLPALALSLLWARRPEVASLGWVPAVSALCVLASLALAWLVHVRLGWMRAPRPTQGAMVLAAGFGNFTYLGLPVLAGVFGPQGAAVAIAFDLLASTPLLFTLGAWIAARLGTRGDARPARELLRAPPLLAALAAVLLSAADVPAPAPLAGALATLGQAVVPLMLVSVGMALSWRRGWLARAPQLVPALAIQLAFMPLCALALVRLLPVPEELRPMLVVEAAMPTMVLGLVFCERYGLDAERYAEAVTLSTALSLFTLPAWLAVA